MNVKNLNSIESYEELRKLDQAFLVDVRTAREWQDDGIPDISDTKSELILLSSNLLPNMDFNEDFISELSSICSDKNAHIFFICKSGVRSNNCANLMIKMGYRNCYNIVDGFKNHYGGGWKTNNLPWSKSNDCVK